MRLWSLSPRYLDSKGLVALWREALLAQKVLMDLTRGYKHHPQLVRFRESGRSLDAIALFLTEVCNEADRRGYHFDRSKIGAIQSEVKIPVHKGQMVYEWKHLKKKLKVRDPSAFDRLSSIKHPDHHPLFYEVEGDVEDWEIREDSPR